MNSCNLLFYVENLRIQPNNVIIFYSDDSKYIEKYIDSIEDYDTFYSVGDCLSENIDDLINNFNKFLEQCIDIALYNPPNDEDYIKFGSNFYIKYHLRDCVQKNKFKINLKKYFKDYKINENDFGLIII